MSWNPLRKLSRQNSRPFQQHQGDYDLEKCVSNLEQLETATKKLHKDAKKYEDLVLEMNRNEQKITTDLSTSFLCQDEETLRNLVEEWHSFTCGLTKADDELIAVFHQVLTDPVKKFHGIFPDVRLALRKIEQVQQECTKLRQKVAKLEEREGTGMNIVKLEHAKHALTVCMGHEQSLHATLKRELPQLLEARIEYFQPIIEAVIRAEVTHWGETATVFGDLVQQVPKNYVPSDVAQRQRIGKIQSLSIIAGS